MNLPKILKYKLQKRLENNTLRLLPNDNSTIDFSSNDYLGFSKCTKIKTDIARAYQNLNFNGSTGSRLISGNHKIICNTEKQITQFHKSERALIFNSGYDANIGFFSCVPQKGDIVFYDKLIHASIRDGLKLSNAKSFSFDHNNLNSLKSKLKHANENSNKYAVIESIYSMDGDNPNLIEFVNFCNKNNIYLIVDEAHSMGIYGQNGEGLVQHLNLQDKIFARIMTYGKAMGIHGASILGSEQLINYLINFCRPFIYTTAMDIHSVLSISTCYNHLKNTSHCREKLFENIAYFKSKISTLKTNFIESNSPIQCMIIGNNNDTKKICKHLKEKDFSVVPILSPTVPKNTERIRFCLHSFNTKQEIDCLIQIISKIHF